MKYLQNVPTFTEYIYYKICHFFQVEICRFGCPDHCQKPSGYAAREQEVSSSINVPQYRPGPRFEAHKAQNNRIDNNAIDNEVGESRRLETLPRPLGLVQAPPPPPPTLGGGPVAQSLVQDREIAQLVNLKEPQQLKQATDGASVQQAPEAQKVPPPPPAPIAAAKNSAPRYVPRPPNSPPTYGATDKSAPSSLPETDKTSPVSEFLEGLRLPKLPSFPNLFGAGGENARPAGEDQQQPYSNPRRVESEAIPVSMGVRPVPGSPRTATVPIHRTDKKDQPLVYPSSFLGGGEGEPPVERPDNGGQLPADGGFPYGPRGLHFDKRSVSGRHRRAAPATPSEEMGVTSGYQVISEVDLAFKPSFENGMGVAVFQVRDISIVYSCFCIIA